MEFTRPIRLLKMTNARHKNERLAVLLSASNKRRHSWPGHMCFEKFIYHQIGLSRSTLPELRHLLTKHRKCQRTPLAIIRCFLVSNQPHTPLVTPRLYRSSCCDPYEVAARASNSGDPFAARRIVSLRPRVSGIHRSHRLQGGFAPPFASTRQQKRGTEGANPP